MNDPVPQVHRLAARMAAIEPFHVVVLVTRAKELEAQGRSIVNMVIGEPDFATPEPIVRAGIAALQAGQVRYTPSLGTPALRHALAGWYRTRYAVDVPAERIAVTSGSSGACWATRCCSISSRPISSGPPMISTRCTRFRSSRTLPGQG